jgi:hypothetical protein
MRGGGERITAVDMPRKSEMERGAPEEQMATHEQGNNNVVGIVQNATEQRNVGTFAYSIKCKWENRLRMQNGDSEIICRTEKL